MKRRVSQFGYSQKAQAVKKLARYISFSELGPSATEEELEKKAEGLPKGHIELLYEMFLRDSKLEGTTRISENIPEDFVLWYREALKETQKDDLAKATA